MEEMHFDIAVIGAGPAGSMAAMRAAGAGRSVALIERNEKPGYPVRCGEGIGMRSLTEHAEPRPEWIRLQVDESMMVSPNGMKIRVSDIAKSVILDREKMDGDLAKEAVRSGARLFVNSPVVETGRTSDGGYFCRCPELTVTAGILIIADGVESRAARFLGWNTRLSPDDIESCAFTRVASPLIDLKSCQFHVGSSVAPGGYAWIFPRGKGEANVGLGISGAHCGPGKPREMLIRFIEREIPGGRYSTIHCGGVPVSRYVRPLVREGAMLVGDAARQVNCISGAGIAYALFSGTMAGESAVSAFNHGKIDFSALRTYEKRWIQRYGKQQERSFALKEFVSLHADDAFLNRVAGTLARKRGKKLRYLTIFLATFSRHPVLMLKAFKLFR